MLFQAENIAIPQGSLVALVGKNGTGKSSLLKALAGLDSLVHGEIALRRRKSVLQTNYFPSETVSYIPVKINPFGAISLLDFVLSGKSTKRNFLDIPTKQEIDEVHGLLEQFQMHHMAQDSFEQLSDGEQKLALIMRSIHRDSEVLLLDEPESFLDVGNRKMIFEWLQNLSKKGKTVIFSTHQPELAASFVDIFLSIEENKLRARHPEEVERILEVLS